MEIEDLKCCGNCKNLNRGGWCTLIIERPRIVLASWYCRDGWEFDKMTAIEREEEAAWELKK